MVCVNRRDLGLLALRVGTGAVLAAHGSQKLAGWFGGGGIQGTTAAMEAMGFHPPKHSAGWPPCRLAGPTRSGRSSRSSSQGSGTWRG
ncbi:DoxX family membrane protein, partial [Streptomyces bacillaris]